LTSKSSNPANIHSLPSNSKRKEERKTQLTNTLSPSSAHVAWSTISDIADVIKPKATNRAEFISECKSGALDGIAVTYRTFDSVAITGKIDSELLDALPKSIKFLCHNGKKEMLIRS
jgi:hypothetical protein